MTPRARAPAVRLSSTRRANRLRPVVSYPARAMISRRCAAPSATEWLKDWPHCVRATPTTTERTASVVIRARTTTSTIQTETASAPTWTPARNSTPTTPTRTARQIARSPRSSRRFRRGGLVILALSLCIAGRFVFRRPARRHGESDQGAEARPVRRSNELHALCRQPVPPAACLSRLRIDRAPPSRGTQRNRPCQSPGEHDPA